MDLPVTADATQWQAAEEQQIERAKRDPQAFAELYRRHHRPISSYVYRRTGDVHATEDLVSDTFLTALRYLPRYRLRGIPIRFWLYRIATNTVNRWARRRGRAIARSISENELPDPSSLKSEPDPGEHRALAALLKLSPKHQAVLALHYIEGLSVEEVAVILGCRTGTVKSRMARAREAMRHKLNGRR